LSETPFRGRVGQKEKETEFPKQQVPKQEFGNQEQQEFGNQEQPGAPGVVITVREAL
jgi:hypothetical protein